MVANLMSQKCVIQPQNLQPKLTAPLPHPSSLWYTSKLYIDSLFPHYEELRNQFMKLQRVYQCYFIVSLSAKQLWKSRFGSGRITVINRWQITNKTATYFEYFTSLWAVLRETWSKWPECFVTISYITLLRIEVSLTNLTAKQEEILIPWKI